MLEAGVQLLAERGLENFNLADVGIAAGYSRGLPAHHFGSKSGFLVALANFIRAKYSEEQIARREEPGLEGLFAQLRRSCRLTHNPLQISLSSIILSDKVRAPPFNMDLGSLKKGSLHDLRQHLLEGVRKGEIRSDINIRRTANMLLITFLSLQEQWLRDRSFDLPGAGEDYIRILQMGLAAPTSPEPVKGRRR